MRYRAFISYASADRAVAERVQRAIEQYRIPAPLRGSDRGFGATPKRLTPLFRDRSDADASGNLGAVLTSALEHSDALVVLCSPASARSRWVNQEIRHFKALGRSSRIFPLIIDGVPTRFVESEAADGAFPPALFQRVDAAGQVIADDDPEPLAADLRLSGDGFEFAKLKIVAGLTGIPLTELTQRQFEAERRERRIVRAVAATMATLALFAAIAAVIAYRSAEVARARLSSAIEMAARRVDDGARFGDQYGVPIEVIRQLLDGAEHDFDSLIGTGGEEAPVLQMQRGRLLTLFSRLYRAVGDSSRQLDRARAAVSALDRVPTSRQVTHPRTWLATLPDRRALVGERLGALEALGVATADGGDTAAALALLEQGRTLAERDARPDFVARFWARIGELRYEAGDLAAASAAQDAALAALDVHLAASGSVEPLDRVAALSDRAELRLERERPREALTDLEAAIALLEAQASAHPDDATVQQSLGHALTRRADVQYAVSGSWDEGRPQLERAVALFERATASDPARIDYARDLSIGLERLGDVWLQTGEVDRAAPLFERLVALRRARVTRDPSSAEARRDLAVGLERVGDLELARSRPAQALDALDEARALRAIGRSSDPMVDPVLSRDLAVLWYKTASARLAAGRPQWSAAYESALALMSPLLAKSDVAPGWLRDVAVFRYGYGEALAKSGNRTAARRQWQEALALVEQQLKRAPDDPRLVDDKRQLQAKLGR